jgi:hypothetical protein
MLIIGPKIIIIKQRAYKKAKAVALLPFFPTAAAQLVVVRFYCFQTRSPVCQF